MMESAHSSMPVVEDFDDPFAAANGAATPPTTSSAEMNSKSTPDATAAETETEANLDPWAVLAAAAGEEAPKPAEEQPTPTQESQQNPPEDQPTTSFAQGETFSMPQQQNEHNNPTIEGLTLLGSQIQTHATNLTRTLSTKIQEVDAKHGISQKVTDAKHNVEERYHISERVSDFHAKVVKPAGDNVVEKVVPSVRESWGAVSTNIRKSVANLNQERTATTDDGVGIDSLDGEAPLNHQQGQIRHTWASLSTAVGNKWNSAATTLGEKAEVWKEGHLQWREEHMKQQKDKQPIDVKETFAGGMNWMSQRFKNKAQVNNDGSPVKQSVVSTLMDMDSRQVDSDGIPSSFFRESM